MMDLFEELRKMQQEMDKLFEKSFGTSKLLSTKEGVVKQPEADLKETEKEIIAKFDLPGVEKGDISLHVDRNSISVKAEKKQEKEEKKEGYLHQERSYHSYCRSFALPAPVDFNHAEAEYKNGVLTVKMSKLKIEHKDKKQIEIK